MRAYSDFKNLCWEISSEKQWKVFLHENVARGLTPGACSGRKSFNNVLESKESLICRQNQFHNNSYDALILKKIWIPVSDTP